MTKKISGSRVYKRAADRRAFPVAFSHVGEWLGEQWAPVSAGRVLLLVTGAVTSVSAPLANLHAADWRVLLPVSVAMTTLLGSSYLVPWGRLPRVATCAFPMSVWAALAVLGLLADGLGAKFVGLIALGFAYIGMTQPARVSLFVLPFAVAAYVCAYDGWSATVAGKLVIAISVWMLLALLLSGFVERQAVLNAKLRAAAYSDALTGVANRRDLESRLGTARSGDTLVLCDIDNFKRLNDTLGHAAGDRVLVDFGVVMRASLRDGDYVARYGGEEFVILLPAPDGVLADSDSTLCRVRERWALLQPDVTFSSGIAVCSDGRTAGETLVAADVALYAAKVAGRNRDQHERRESAPIDAELQAIHTLGWAVATPTDHRGEADW